VRAGAAPGAFAAARAEPRFAAVARAPACREARFVRARRRLAGRARRPASGLRSRPAPPGGSIAPVSLEDRVRELLAGGDTDAAATEIIRTLGPKIAGFLHSALRNGPDAADALSTWSENVWRGIGSFRGDASVRTWTFKIAWNAAQNVRDQAWKRFGRPFETGEASRLAAEVWTRTVERLERQRDRLATLRQSLTPEEQTLMSLRIDQGLSWDDVADVLSVDAATLRKRFERVKERLARLAREQGLLE
jgi:RNA polymerase sigma-70 factor (ECF subfamily)